MNRRDLLRGAGAVCGVTGAQGAVQDAAAPDWGGPVLDIHFHMRRAPEANPQHLDGCGVRKAILLTRAADADQASALAAQGHRRFAWSVSADITKPDAEQVLTAAVKRGAIGIGELKFHVECDGPELQRVYALAGELGVPILVHFQEVPHYEGEGVFSTGFQRFAQMLKKYPKTKFVGHADAFWANISADYRNQEAYPGSAVVPGGVTDKLLGEYPNLFGDLSANSGNNALSRSPEFTAAFLKRHADKLVFGSDCACSDGRGSGIGQPNNPAAKRLAGQCVAQATLRLLRQATTPALFRRLTWENGHRLYKLQA